MMYVASTRLSDTCVPNGAEWLGRIPVGWAVKKMKYLFRDHSQKGRADAELLSVTQNQGVVPRSWVENRMVMPTRGLDAFKFIEKGDFAISLRSFEGGLEYCYHDGVISPAYTVLKAWHPDLDPSYYRHLFKSGAFISELQTSVVGIREGKSISFGELSHSLMPIPPLCEQQAIAAFLDEKCAKLDEAVRIKEKQITLLRERRRILIQQTVTRGLNPDAPMKHSGNDLIGQIPAHWVVKPCRYAFRSVRRTDRDGTEVKLSVTQQRGIIPTDEMEENSNQARDFDAFQICFPSDLVLNKYKAHLGVFWAAPMRGIITNNYTVFQPLHGIISKYFEELFHTSLYLAIFRNTVYGVTEGMAPLYTNDFYALPAICPPEEEQLQIIEYITVERRRFDELIRIKEDQIAALKIYKTSLINEATTGKIRVI